MCKAEFSARGACTLSARPLTLPLMAASGTGTFHLLAFQEDADNGNQSVSLPGALPSHTFPESCKPISLGSLLMSLRGQEAQCRNHVCIFIRRPCIPSRQMHLGLFSSQSSLASSKSPGGGGKDSLCYTQGRLTLHCYVMNNVLAEGPFFSFCF